MTPELQERNPFIGIAMLVAVLALVAGLASRFGLNALVAGICVVIAVVGTWLLLSPEIEVLESTTPGSGATARSVTRPAGAGQNVSAFASTSEAVPREQLRSTPRVAVGFDSAEGAGPRGTEPARLGSIGDEVFVDSVAPVQALGQLPQDATALHIATAVDPASNVSGAYTLGQFEVRAASRRGSDHVILNDPRQDDYVVASAAGGRYLVVVIADGEGSAENAHFGSYWSSRLLAQAIDQHLRDGVPGIENMLARTRDEVSELFDLRFTDGTKMRTIATTLVGVIAPIGGGPAAGFRVGDSDILVRNESGWSSLFEGTAIDTQDDTKLFPRDIDADVAPITFESNCLMLVSDGVAKPFEMNEEIATECSAALAEPISEVEFDQLMTFPLEEARGDRTAVAVWFRE